MPQQTIQLVECESCQGIGSREYQGADGYAKYEHCKPCNGTGERPIRQNCATIAEYADEFLKWDGYVNVHTFDLFKIAAKAWNLSQEQQNALVAELSERGII